MSEAHIPDDEVMHTPGPWHFHGPERIQAMGDIPEEWHGYAWVGHGNGDQWDGVLAMVDRHKDSSQAFRDRAVPDARLIAAAPDLLAGAKAILAARSGQQSVDAVIQLRDAIAKAEGRSRG